VPRPVIAPLFLVVQLALCIGPNAQGRFISDRPGFQVGVAFSAVDNHRALGFAASIFSDGFEVGMQRTTISGDTEDDNLTSYGGYVLGYLVRPTEERRESMAVGPFIESISDGDDSALIGGVQLTGSQQVFASEGITIAPELSVAIGVGLENYEGSPVTGASLSMGIAAGSPRTGLFVLDPIISISGQGGGLGIGLRVSGILPFRRGE